LKIALEKETAMKTKPTSVQPVSVLVSAGGKVLLEVTQKEWRYQDPDFSTALFAGKMMELCSSGEDGTEGFELQYLGFKSSPQTTKEAAMQVAPEFARAVLRYMITLIEVEV
jgi:hypothetical protein